MFLKRLMVLFYVTIVLFISGFMLYFALNIVPFGDFVRYSEMLYQDHDLRWLTGILAGIMLLCNLFFYRYFSVNVHRDKVIAFDNPSGRVSVSLLAMEELIKRMLIRRPEVKDSRVKITASKKGLDVKIRLIIKAEANIPDLTFKIQDIVKRKIQDTIGLEEPINVAIYVGKILPEKIKGTKDETKPPEEDQAPPPVPFQGYRA